MKSLLNTVKSKGGLLTVVAWPSGTLMLYLPSTIAPNLISAEVNIRKLLFSPKLELDVNNRSKRHLIDKRMESYFFIIIIFFSIMIYQSDYVTLGIIS